MKILPLSFLLVATAGQILAAEGPANPEEGRASNPSPLSASQQAAQPPRAPEEVQAAGPASSQVPLREVEPEVAEDVPPISSFGLCEDLFARSSERGSFDAACVLFANTVRQVVADVKAGRPVRDPPTLFRDFEGSGKPLVVPPLSHHPGRFGANDISDDLALCTPSHSGQGSSAPQAPPS